MDDWAKVYAGLPDRQLLALNREPETLRQEAQDALAVEIRKRGLEVGGEASIFPEAQLAPADSSPSRSPLGILGGTNVIMLLLLLIVSPFEVDGLRTAGIMIGFTLVPGTFLVARNAVSSTLRILSAIYSGLAACLLAWHIVTMNLAAMHPTAFAIGDQICFALFALLATVNAFWLLDDEYSKPKSFGSS